VNDNVVRVVVRPGAAAGEPAAVRVEPPTRTMEVRVTAVTGAAGSDPTLEIRRQWMPRAANVIEVTGAVPLDADSVDEELTVEEPALYAATLLGELLAARGVEVRGGIRHGPLLAGEAADTIAVHVSDSLAASVRNFLKISDNLSGEQLVKVIAAEVAAPPGGYAEGLAAERAFLAASVGLDTLAFKLADGSGVSRYNVVTAGQIVQLLRYMAAQDELAEPWIAALPIAGVDGTLARRMRGTPAEGRARAKTGTLQGVSAVSGYVPTADGERLAFSMIMEFYVGAEGPRRAVQDSVIAALAGFRR
jgi:D-alanyl-D-alanine carboxypeptidase/D-alanyl-D-alanine-endopeptidase (penicillin-binding protein 4)